MTDVWGLEQARINSFDPADAYHACHIQLVRQMFNTLTDVDTTGHIVPSLATAWHSDDGISWTFELRKDVYFVEDTCFHSKEERLFTAKDVKFTFERLLDKDSQSMGVSYLTDIHGVEDFRNGESDNIQGIVVKDDNTIIFILDKVNFNFPNMLSLPYCSIVKERAVKEYDPKVKPVGTGPFKFVKYIPDKSISLIRNDNYWENAAGRRVPEIKGLEILLSEDDNYSFLLFKNRKSDFVELNASLRKQHESARYSFETEMTSVESVQLNFYLFNLTTVRDPEIRKGISYAIDRAGLQKFLGEEGKIVTSLYPKMFENLHTEKEILRTDREKAGAILFGKSLRLKLVTFDDLLSRSIASIIKETLGRFDVSLDVESVPFPVLVDRLTSGDYDMIQMYWGMLFADPDHFLSPFKSSSFPPGGNNFNRYENASFEEAVNTALINGGEDQAKYYWEAEDTILDDMPFVLLYYKNTNILTDMRFTLPTNPLLYKYYKYASLRNLQ